MKKNVILYLILIISTVGLAQKSTMDFFPEFIGYRWIYQNTPLDSNNMPLSDLTTFQVDSFVANNQLYENKMAKLIISKLDSQQAATDSLYFSFEENDVWSYVQPALLSGFSDSLGIVNLLNSNAGWYDLFRFNTGSAYTIFSKDTTLTLDTLVLPLRFAVKGKKSSDTDLTTGIGSFSCKRFVLTASVSYVANPYIVIPLVQIPDTIYIAPGNWIVRQARTSQVIDLSQLAELTGNSFNIPKFYLNGSVSQIVDSIPQVGIQLSEKKSELKTANYPNPFNNQTVIAFTIPQTKLLKMKIYDITGRLIYSKNISDLVSGTHYEHLNMNYFSGGIYTYTIEADKQKVNGKLVLVK